MQPFHRQAEGLIEKEFIFYFRTNRPEITVAVLSTKDGRYVSAASVCSIKDQFCKKIGRAIARGRAEKKLIKDGGYEVKDFSAREIAVGEVYKIMGFTDSNIAVVLTEHYTDEA